MNKKIRRFIVVAALALLLIGMSRSAALADSDYTKYMYVINASSMAPNGMTIDISGTGTLSTHAKTVTGGGVYTHHFSPDDEVRGRWEAVQLLSFVGYGCEGEDSSVLVCGGQALILVHIVADGGLFEGDGILEVDSPFGDSPSGTVAGVKLAVPKALNFNNELSGFTAFYPLP